MCQVSYLMYYEFFVLCVHIYIYNIYHTSIEDCLPLHTFIMHHHCISFVFYVSSIIFDVVWKSHYITRTSNGGCLLLHTFVMHHCHWVLGILCAFLRFQFVCLLLLALKGFDELHRKITRIQQDSSLFRFEIIITPKERCFIGLQGVKSSSTLFSRWSLCVVWCVPRYISY